MQWRNGHAHRDAGHHHHYQRVHGIAAVADSYQVFAVVDALAAKVYARIFPNYQLLIERYAKAQDVEKSHELLDSQRG